ncbi:hypothetical protein [Absidia glauca]|uniref:Transcription initiation factor TFIID subunit 4 n=1 Tax=Absidia glauca TaxID=4829 RepID=A0A163IW30_ABSGL|nr:hypothetical protein [Absidia glauca]
MDTFISSDIHQQRADLGPESTFQLPSLQQNVEPPSTYMNTELLASMMNKLAKSMDVPHLESSAVVYLALATQQRLQECIVTMIEASRHRVDSQAVEIPPLDPKDQQPLYKVSNVQDIRKQLLAIERVEREEERKRRQALAERERNAHLSDGGGPGGGGGTGTGSGSGGGGAGGDGDDGDDDTSGNKKKKKKKKEMGPGASARNMSEDIYKQATNKTALMSAGGIRKSWMLAGMASNATSGGVAPKETPSTASPSVSESSHQLPSSTSSSPAAAATTTTTNTTTTTTTATTKLPTSSSRLSLAQDFNSTTHSSPSLPSSLPSTSSFKSELVSTEDTSARGGRGRPRGRKSEGSKRGRSSSSSSSSVASSKRERTQDFYLPPSMIGRHHSHHSHHQTRLGEQPSRTVTLIDAVHALEYELDSGCECGNRALIKSYNQYLK